jgi:DNA uptake protein ComE-like DNA-binding protein
MGSGHPRVISVTAILVMVLSTIVIYRCSTGWHSHQTASSSISTLELDPNTASADELACLPELGPAAAKRIVAYRSERQAVGIARPFASEKDLDKVNGIGPRTLEEIRPYLRYRPADSVGSD